MRWVVARCLLAATFAAGCDDNSKRKPLPTPPAQDPPPARDVFDKTKKADPQGKKAVEAR